ncbi:guanine-1-methyltransferase-domain-containing protein [Phaeosphaeria sp. MPI-PUGE-AT-0046c]|nr:guanine-1-methyltransferase-domain-containing protein [Phaeosphaeria sp. MPI-PUGE-AT-0046c]
MVTDERPYKMRKLEHEDEEDVVLNDEMAATSATSNGHPPMIAEESENTPSTGDVPDGADGEPKISKNQLKKLRRHERWEAGRDDRKLKRKEKAKERKERKREAWKEQNVDENGNVPKMPPSRPPRHFAGHGSQVPITVVFDCDFEEYMYDHELKSLGLQITRCFSDNRKAKYRTHLALSSFGGKMKERFDGILAQQYKSWRGFQFFEEDFVAVAERSKEWMESPKEEDDLGALRPTATTSDPNGEATSDDTGGEGEIVYLSSESDNVLTHLKPNSTYIIGGLVDKNRHKGICHRRAVNRGIKTAKLPIKEYLEMQDRQVLVTNHVLEILLKWMEFGDWGKAFMEVMPKRKGGKLREDGEHDDGDAEQGEVHEGEQEQEEMVVAAKEAVEDAEGTVEPPEKEVIETTKGLPVGETEAD